MQTSPSEEDVVKQGLGHVTCGPSLEVTRGAGGALGMVAGGQAGHFLLFPFLYVHRESEATKWMPFTFSRPHFLIWKMAILVVFTSQDACEDWMR